MHQKNATNRLSKADPAKVAELYAQFTELGRETDTLRQERNDTAKAMKVCSITFAIIVLMFAPAHSLLHTQSAAVLCSRPHDSQAVADRCGLQSIAVQQIGTSEQLGGRRHPRALSYTTWFHSVQGKMEQAERDKLIQKGSDLKARLADYEERLKALENALQVEAQKMPNLTHPDVAVGGEEDARVLREVGAAPSLDFEV